MDSLYLGIKKAVDGVDSILLVGHQDTDGDALGSMLALKIIFDQCGKKTDVFSACDIPENLRFLPQASQIKKTIDRRYDLIVGVDYGDINRLEPLVFNLHLSLPSVTFDHHPYLNQAGDFLAIDTNASSTCEVIYHFFKINNLKIDSQTATCLLTGIFSDTWNLRHSNATATTFLVAGNLLSHGAPLNKIIKISNQNNISVKAKIWGIGLANMILDKETGFVFCFFSFHDLLRYQAVCCDLSGLSSFISAVPEAKFSLVLSEFTPGYFDGSLRTLPDKGIDVSQIAKALGGGGHELSAGFKTKRQPKEVFQQIKNLIQSS